MLKIFILNFIPLLLYIESTQTSQLNLNDILIRKPYETVFDEITTTKEPEHIDQLNEQCPLEFKSSSLNTGCTCNFKTKTIDCIYSNRLSKIPEFVNTSSNIQWNLDLRCKNLSYIPNLTSFLPLENVNILDLSYHQTPKNICKNLHNETLLRLSKLGSPNPITDLDKHNLTINQLNLESNNLKYINLINNTNYDLKINSLRLSNNQLETIDIKTDVDLCYLRLECLNVSNNRLKRIEIGFLVFLKRLNLSQNHLTLFQIDFYDTKDFRYYYSQSCKFKNSSVLLSALTDLDISINYLSSLPFNHLSIKYMELINLNLSSNRIRELRNYDFSNMPNLIRLDLNSNLISELSNKTFYYLNRLEYLDLSFNFLTTLPKNIFHDQRESLESLNLNHNNLSQVPKEQFKYLGHVKYLYLSQNRIQTLQNYSFGFMFSLIELYLSGNEIESIEADAFSIDEQSYYGPGLIEKLDLSFNKLVSLNKSIFSYLTNLRYIILNNNKLRMIDAQVFQGVNYLLTVDLRLNMLKDLEFLSNKNFSLLRTLKLSNNLIEFIRPGQFLNLKSLNYLDLSGNRLKYINSCAFYGLQNTIRKLFLNYNLITRLNTCAFTLSFKNLRFVQIMHNPLNCTNNCEFFFTIYNPPYSINYQGVECVNNTLSSRYECSQKNYDRIFNKCKLEEELNDCAELANDEGFNFNDQKQMDYDYNLEKSLLQMGTNKGCFGLFENVKNLSFLLNVQIFVFFLKFYF